MAKVKVGKKAAKNELPEQLRAIIEGRDLTAYAVGQLAEVNASIVSRFVAGERDLRFETAGKIATALGLRLVEVGKRARR